MSKKTENWKDSLGEMVFSTNKEESTINEEEQILEPVKVKARKQILRIWLDKKSRNGKSVTLITGYEGSPGDLKDLAGELKKLCGVGGTVKFKEILIQGDHREKIKKYLLEKGYKNTKLAGG